jgi:hypothetical protein
MLSLELLFIGCVEMIRQEGDDQIGERLIAQQRPALGPKVKAGG